MSEINTRVIMVGDFHIQGKAPISRIDDWKATVEDKINQIRALSRDNKADILIAGDVFSKIQTDNEFIVWALRLFKKLGEFGKVYTVIGNHDIHRSQYQLEDKTPLKILEEAGLVNILRNGNPIKMGSITIKGFGYYDDLSPAEGDNNLLILHKFFNQSRYKEHNLQSARVDELGYKFVLAGHDHAYYPIHQTNNGALVFRPGSLIRGTSHDYNFDRKIYVVMFDTETLDYLEVPLRIKPMNEVVSESVLTGRLKDNSSEDDVFSEYLDKVTEVVSGNNLDEEINTLIGRINGKAEYKENVRSRLIHKIING
ncbi:MAG: metallophosphoesterase [Cetobacterium sp.]